MLGASLTLAAGGALGARDALPRDSADGAESVSGMDPLTVAVRLRGRLEGGLWVWIQGDVFGRRPEETLRPLAGFCSVLRMRYRPVGERGYVFEQRESAHFYDVATGEILEEFANPYTGATNVAVGYVSPRFEFRIDADGVYFGEGLDVRQGGIPRGIETDGTDVWTTEIRANEYPTGLRHKEFPEAFASEIRRSRDIATYRARIARVIDDELGIVPARVSFLADVPWLQWMLMGKVPGHAFWYGQGSKCADWRQMPASLSERVQRIHPGFLEDPWGLDGRPYGTLYQMRRLREAGRI